MKVSTVPSELWLRVAQSFVGLFFLAAAYMKAVDAFFGKATAPLANDFQYWLSSGFTVSWYRPVLTFLIPYGEIIGVFVILLQGTAGILLLLNYRVRWAGILLLFVQTNILLSVLHGWGFIHFVGISIWLGLYFFWKEGITGRRWMILSYALFALYAVLIHGRFTRGDGHISYFPEQFAHFSQDIMSITPHSKQWMLILSEWHMFPMLWAAMWWLHLAVLLLLFTRYRLGVGVVWSTLLIARVLIWTNGVTSEGVLWVLVVFVWLTQEEVFQRKIGVVHLLPTLSFWKRLFRRTT